MVTVNEILQTLKNASNGLNLAELLKLHPMLAKRTAQRWVKQLSDNGQKLLRSQEEVDAADQNNMQALIIEELRRLHEEFWQDNNQEYLIYSTVHLQGSICRYYCNQ